MGSVEILKALAVMAEFYGREFKSDAPIRLLADDLREYPTGEVLNALARCRRELRGFPTLADILDRMNAADGRPGPEEAWSMLPHSEYDSVVWTSEMREAHAASHTLMDNPVQARLAFVEVYKKLVHEARDIKRPTQWHASLGHDPGTRQKAILEAVDRGRITQDYANTLLPEPINTSETLQITGPQTVEEKINVEEVRKLLKSLGSIPKPDEKKMEMSPKEEQRRRELLRSQIAILSEDDK